MSVIIKLDTNSAATIRKRWNELNGKSKDDAYYDEAGKILNDELEMYKQQLQHLSDAEKEGLTADLLTPQQQTNLDEIRRIIEEKNVASPIDQKFNEFLSSITQRSKLGGRKSNKRSRSRSSSRSQNKRYSRRGGNGKRRQYSSRRK